MKHLEFWRNWSKPVGGLRWRAARIDDLLALERLQDTKDRLLGKQDRPAFFSPPTMLTLVCEDEGTIVGGMVCEVTIDISMIGCDREAFETTPEVAPDLAAWLKTAGFRFASIVVPKMLSARMAETLKKMGFRSKEVRSAYWSRHL